MLHCLAKLEEVAGACVIRQSVDGIAFFSLSHLQLLNLEKRLHTFCKNCKNWKTSENMSHIFHQPVKVLRLPGRLIKQTYNKNSSSLRPECLEVSVTMLQWCNSAVEESVTVLQFECL